MWGIFRDYRGLKKRIGAIRKALHTGVEEGTSEDSQDIQQSPEEENEDAAGGVRNYGSTGSTPPMASSTSIALPRPRPSPFINGEGQSQSEIEQIRSMSVPSLPQALKRQTPLRGKTDVPV